MISTAIQQLVNYGLDTGLILPDDEIYIRNQLLMTMQLDDFTAPEGEVCYTDLESILKTLVDDAAARGVCADNSTARDLFDTKLMGVLTPRPSIVRANFEERYENEGPQAATDWFYKFSQDTDYIRRYRIKRDLKWVAKTPYGDLDITINLSKPEKDPKAIAAAKNKAQAGYPKCLLCPENEGYAGRMNHPARQNHRVIQRIETFCQRRIGDHRNIVIAHYRARFGARYQFNADVQTAQNIDSDNRFPFFKAWGQQYSNLFHFNSCHLKSTSLP